MAVNKFKKMRQSIASCLDEPESQTDTGMAPVSKSGRSLEDIWVSLVKYLVLQHKSHTSKKLSSMDDMFFLLSPGSNIAIIQFIVKSAPSIAIIG